MARWSYCWDIMDHHTPETNLYMIPWLVVEPYPSEKYIWVHQLGLFFHSQLNGKKHVPNHQDPKILGLVHLGVSENSVPHLPNGFADHYPVFKWLFHWEYTQHFQTNPFISMVTVGSPWVEPHLQLWELWAAPGAAGWRAWNPSSCRGKGSTVPTIGGSQEWMVFMENPIYQWIGLRENFNRKAPWS